MPLRPNSGADKAVNSTALEAQNKLLAAPGTLHDVVIYNNGGSDVYAQLHDTTTTLTGGEVPKAVIKVLTGNQNAFYYGGGRPFRTGITVAISSTVGTFTSAGANAWFDATLTQTSGS